MVKKSDIWCKDVGIGPYHPSTGTTLKDNPELFLKEEQELEELLKKDLERKNKAIKRMWWKNLFRLLTFRKPLRITID